MLTFNQETVTNLTCSLVHHQPSFIEVFSSDGWANSITGLKLSVSLIVCLCVCVNQTVEWPVHCYIIKLHAFQLSFTADGLSVLLCHLLIQTVLTLQFCARVFWIIISSNNCVFQVVIALLVQTVALQYSLSISLSVICLSIQNPLQYVIVRALCWRLSSFFSISISTCVKSYAVKFLIETLVVQVQCGHFWQRWLPLPARYD